MKLAKLSLAAIVAAGALTTVSAQPLEEAIKGVEFSGMLRYRNNQVKVDSDKTVNQNDWDFLGKFTAPVTSDIKAVLAFASKSDAGNNQTANGLSSLHVDLRKAFFVYKKEALTVKAGMMAVGTPVTDNGFNGNKGNGVLAMYNAGPVTVAGAYFSGVNAASADNEVMAAAVIGSMGPVSAQVWGITIPNVVDLMTYAQLSGKVAGVGLTGQFINTDLENGVDGNFYALKASYKMNNFAFNAGYTNNDEDQGLYSLAGADSAGVIHPGWRLGYDIDNVADAESYFVDAGASFGKVGVKVGYAAADVDASNQEWTEMWGQVSYKVAKNLNTYVKYSNTEEDNANYDRDYFRFEAKYSF